ncbi:hypothetical protein Droror1_Dr00022357 [Drosera rotundifolia]
MLPKKCKMIPQQHIKESSLACSRTDRESISGWTAPRACRAHPNHKSAASSPKFPRAQESRRADSPPTFLNLIHQFNSSLIKKNQQPRSISSLIHKLTSANPNDTPNNQDQQHDSTKTNRLSMSSKRNLELDFDSRFRFRSKGEDRTLTRNKDYDREWPTVDEEKRENKRTRWPTPSNQPT